MKKAAYKSPNYGGRIGYSIFHFIIKRFGVYPAYALLILLLPYYTLFLSKPRRAASHYLKRRFKTESRLGLLIHTAKYYFEFGKTLIDQGALGILGEKNFKISFPKEKELFHLAQNNRPLVLLTSHIGAWRTAMTCMFNLPKKVSLHFNLEEHMQGKHFFDIADKKDNFTFISPNLFLGGIIELTNALMKGECVSMMGDRSFGAKKISAKFLGEMAYFPATPFQLAVSTGAEIIVLLTSRKEKLSIEIEYHRINTGVALEELSRDEAMKILAGKYIECLEKFLWKNPYMWLNFFNIWDEENLN